MIRAREVCPNKRRFFEITVLCHTRHTSLVSLRLLLSTIDLRTSTALFKLQATRSNRPNGHFKTGMDFLERRRPWIDSTVVFKHSYPRTSPARSGLIPLRVLYPAIGPSTFSQTEQIHSIALQMRAHTASYQLPPHGLLPPRNKCSTPLVPA
jgi:hypothetical protein